MNSPLSLAPGFVIGGDFCLLRTLGSGGMGAVFVARQLSTDQLRAVKVMHAQLAGDERSRERFVQEARVGARVESAHVVQVIAAGIDAATSMPWLAMELLDGEDLAGICRRRGALAAAEVLEILRQVGHALGTAHAAGIVHRDVKPENVFLARSRSSSAPAVVKVLDFGIAKVMAASGAKSTTSMGTPLWMAPEQTEPRSKVGPPSDVWAIGLLAFWLLTGRSYWRCASEQEASLQALLREILFDELVPASTRARQLGVAAPLPPGFDAWFARCVVRDPAARFADARAAIDSLGPASNDAAPLSLAPLLASPSAPTGRAPMASSPPPSTSPAASTVPLLPGPAAASSDLPPAVASRTLRADASSPVIVASPSHRVAQHRGPLAIVMTLLVASFAVALTGTLVWRAARRSKLAITMTLGPVSASAPQPEVSSVVAPSASEGAASVDAPVAIASSSASVASRRGQGASWAASARASASAIASSSASVAPPPSASSGPPRPFDRRVAEQRLAMAAQMAKPLCQRSNGSRLVNVVVVFGPSGKVVRSTAQGQAVYEGTGMCVQSLFRTLSIPPYDGGEEPLAATVALD